MNGWMDVWMDGWMDGWMCGWLAGWTDGQMDRRTDGWVCGWMDGCVDGWMDGWKEGRKWQDFYSLGSSVSGVIRPVSALLRQDLDPWFDKDWVGHTASGKGPELRPS